MAASEPPPSSTARADAKPVVTNPRGATEDQPPSAAQPPPNRSSADPTRPLFYFSALLAGCAVVAVHFGAAHLPHLYLAPWSHATWVAASALAVAGMAAGLALGHRSRHHAARMLPVAALVSSVVLLVTTPAVFAAFGTRQFLPIALTAPCLIGLALAWFVTLGWHAVLRYATLLGAAERLANPFRLFGLLIAVAIAMVLESSLGVLRTGAGLAMVCALLGWWAVVIHEHLYRLPLKGARWCRRGAWAALGIATLGLFLCETIVPAAELARYPNTIVHVADGSRQRLVTTSGQAAYELFIDDRLKLSLIDEYRYSEAMTHPALVAATRPRRVAILGGGSGVLAREVLKHSDVEVITVVCVDAELSKLGKRAAWLVRQNGQALESSKIRILQQEPIVWARDTSERFDVVIVDVPDPTDHVEGKNYTRYFYERLLERLAPGGVAAIQLTSPFKSPRTHNAIAATLRAAGANVTPYHAAIPMYGVWGFALASLETISLPSKADRLPSNLKFLAPATLQAMFSTPGDLPTADATTDVAVSTLPNQTVVEVFDKELHPVAQP